jgi:hypothetical protein
MKYVATWVILLLAIVVIVVVLRLAFRHFGHVTVLVFIVLGFRILWMLGWAAAIVAGIVEAFRFSPVGLLVLFGVFPMFFFESALAQDPPMRRGDSGLRPLLVGPVLVPLLFFLWVDRTVRRLRSPRPATQPIEPADTDPAAP